ncbi:hypothetical protein EDC14_102160 [Hydrogenispora ethanolica]|jgi:hypothetical protein|uniref:ABC-2 family transporter n=1 Tax=Hydrogenispora ethanolica TaxID=1082276 RepID=A0A4R1RCX7_HYDET|nr:hypothetical protein [Hydrogenispora ethanolica]TCL63342.1 hypothetical protein EDC14_102160 [Hydrogenispora ethanolica]
MLKLIKWDLFNFVQRYSWLYLSYGAVLLATAIFPRHIEPFSSGVDGIAALYSMYFYVYTWLLSVTATVSWLRKGTAQLELSLPLQPEKLLLSKFLLAISINLSGMLLSKILWTVINQFGMSRMVLFTHFSGLIEYITVMAIIAIVIMFSYITAKSFSFIRNRARLATIVIAFGIITVLVGLAFLLFNVAGTHEIVVKNHGNIYVLPTSRRQWLVQLCGALGSLAVILAGFWGSCSLLRHKFERY